MSGNPPPEVLTSDELNTIVVATGHSLATVTSTWNTPAATLTHAQYLELQTLLAIVKAHQ